MAPEGAAPKRLTIDTLYREHVREIYGLIYSRVGNRETAEDLTSEVFMKAMLHLDGERPAPSLVAWLYRVAHNTVNDYWRALYRMPVIALDEARTLRRPPTMEDPPRQEHAAAQAAALLQRLPSNYRQVLTLRLLEGLSVAETAARMGISEGNVKVLQHRALRRAAVVREQDSHDAG
jgi:RNA polymerase sigma-70 factor (ECF subfamily)